jgi:hypothetical protein
MFDASLCPADVLQQITDLRRRLIEIKLEWLCPRDVELLFFNDYCRPDWSLADVLGADVDKIVREIFDLSHDVARAEDELELRARPN